MPRERAHSRGFWTRSPFFLVGRAPGGSTLHRTNRGPEGTVTREDAGGRGRTSNAPDNSATSKRACVRSALGAGTVDKHSLPVASPGPFVQLAILRTGLPCELRNKDVNLDRATNLSTGARLPVLTSKTKSVTKAPGVPLRSCGGRFPRIAARFFTFRCAYPQSTRLIDL